MVAYATGTVTATNGSKVVDGAGTSFLPPNVYPGDFLVIVGDGKLNEIGTIESATRLNLMRPFVGGGGGGLGFFVVPAQTHEGDLALRASMLLNVFGALVDGIGQGLFPSGTAATPALRNRDDPDTGLFFPGPNQVALSAGGIARLTTSAASLIAALPFLPAASGQAALHGYRNDPATSNLRLTTSFPGGTQVDLNSGINGISNGGFDLRLNDVSRMVVDPAGNAGFGTNNPQGRLQAVQSLAAPNACQMIVGYQGSSNFYDANIHSFRDGSFNEVLRLQGGNLLAGATSGSSHVFARGNAQGQQIIQFSPAANTAYGTARFYLGAGYTPAGAATCFFIDANSTTGRSINAAGTINTGGNDYAEYMYKTKACGVLAKGQIVGIGVDGKLTDKHSLAHSFVLKSTDPSFVGGDTWSPGPPPAEPLLELPSYDGPVEPIAPAGVTRELPDLGDEPAPPVQKDGEEMMAFALRLAAWINASTAWLTAMNARPAEIERLEMDKAADTAAAERYAAELPIWKKAQAAYRAAIAAAEQAHAAALAKHKTDYAAWEVEVEKARACVDRIAFAGQVPCNVAAGTFKPGDYIVAAKGKDDTIVGLVVTNANMRLPTNAGMRCDAVGKVWRTMADGRAWVAVLIG